MVHLKQIRIFTNGNHNSLVMEVNNFIRNNKVKVSEIKYSTSGGNFLGLGIEYSAMIVIEEEEK